MADEPNPNPEVPAEPPPEPPPPPPPPVEATDESGVPWKNRAMENERKLREQEAANKYLLEQVQNRPAPPPTPTPARQAADDDQELETAIGNMNPEAQDVLRKLARSMQRRAEKIAEQVGYGLMKDVTHSSTLQQDSELLEETRKQYQFVQNDPTWAGANERQMRDVAIANARVVLATKRGGKSATSTTPSTTGRQDAPPPGIPPTNRGAPQPEPGEKEKFMGEWKKDQANLTMFKKFYPGVELTSEEGQKYFNEAAEWAWRGPSISGTTGAAAQILGLANPKGER